jgi:aspartyl-tRNA(Asn)/glutamyl-tRNA(Gln) amidotransferase subunit C
MPLTSQEIQKIASLAKLDLNASQEARVLSQINAFFEIVEQIKSVDTSNVSPLSHPLATIQEVSLRLRADQVSEANQRELNQKSAPEVEKGLFLVPKVIES